MTRERNRSIVTKCIQEKKSTMNEELFKLRKDMHTKMCP